VLDLATIRACEAPRWFVVVINGHPWWDLRGDDRYSKGMDARIRLRYQEDRAALEQWVSVRTVIGTPVEKAKEESETPGSGTDRTQGGTPAAGGEVRPAA
jgi:hypothetical protein